MSFVVFNHIKRSPGPKCTIFGVNLDGKVLGLRRLVSQLLSHPENEIELLSGGEKLKDDKPLASYNLKEGSAVYALKKVSSDEPTKSEKMSRSEVQDVVRALQGALANPAYRNTVEKILAKPETLETMLASSPALSSDPVAVGMLQDPELLGILADPKYIDKVIEKHPGLAKAAMFITTALREEYKRQGASGRRRGAGHYSLDRLSDDEEEMDTSGGAPAQPITTNLLASALAAATAAGQAQQAQASTSASTGSPGSGSMPGGSSGISADFFRQALQQAISGGSPAGAPGAGGGASNQQQQATPPQPAVTESQLQQLREMGITDENVARQALMAAGGDIQGALEIIFGEGL